MLERQNLPLFIPDHLAVSTATPKVWPEFVVVAVETDELQNNWELSEEQFRYQLWNSLTPQEREIVLTDKFTVITEMYAWYKQASELADQGVNIDQIVDANLRKTKNNILAFVCEYLNDSDVFPNWLLWRQDSEGEMDLFTQTGQKLTDIVLPQERGGAVNGGIKKAIEMLRDAKPGETVIVVSPPGETGLVSDKGKSIIHKDSQLYAYQKKGRGITALTFRSFDLQLENCESLVGKEQNTQTRWDRIRQVMLNPIKVAGDFEDIVSLIEEHTGISHDQLREDLKDRNNLFRFQREILAEIDSFETFVRASVASMGLGVLSGVAIELSKTILKIARHAMVNSSPVNLKTNLITTQTNDNYSEAAFYHQMKDFLKTKKGCNDEEDLVYPYGFVVDYDTRHCQLCNKPKSETGKCHICKDCEEEINAKN
jgi:hypothetical protein